MMSPARTFRSVPARVLRAGVALLCAALLLFGGIVPAAAISRDTVIARSQRWVDLQVPYSQSRFFEGYRTDCSGFVSMAWALTNSAGSPISPATDVLPRFGTRITKEQLLPGDMIVRPKTATSWGHSVIFGGWADDARATYWAYEQSGSFGGARRQQTPYPYWPSPGLPYEPYRYTGITEGGEYAVRVYGSNRYETAARASQQTFPDSKAVEAVVLATGETWPDALGGAALAGAVRGPILLTGSASLSSSARRELTRLAPGRVFVLGGPGAISDNVIEQVEAAGVNDVERIGGSNRYETAALVARKAVAEMGRGDEPFDGTVYVATGRDFADALAVSPIAAARRRPVLLVDAAYLPRSTAAALSGLKVSRAHVIGGNGAVSSEVLDELEASGLAVHRIAGENRYSTALSVAAHGVEEGLSRTSAGLTTGMSFPDALAAGPALGLSLPETVVYLTPSDRLQSALHSELRTHREEIGVMRLYGGPAALRDQVRAEASAALRGW